MDDKDKRRARTLPAIARLARSRDFRSTFGEIFDKPNEQTIIPALPDDTISYVLDRLSDSGGTAVLVMMTEGEFRIAALLPASPARMAIAEEDGTVTPVHEECRVDMFFEYLTYARTAVVRRVAAKLVDHGPLVLA